MILLTGGSGILGQEIEKRLEVHAPSHEELDIANEEDVSKIRADIIIHCAAYTNVNDAEWDRKKCYEVNVIGTKLLSSLGIPMLYMSTDSVFDGEEGNYNEYDIPYPKNFYSLTKLLGEKEVTNGIIIRGCPKTRPWAHEVACTDRFSSAEYVDEIAEKIVKAVSIFDRLPRIVHIGSKRRSHYELAQITKPNVKPIEIKEYKIYRGRDISLSTSLWDSL